MTNTVQVFLQCLHVRRFIGQCFDEHFLPGASLALRNLSLMGCRKKCVTSHSTHMSVT